MPEGQNLKGDRWTAKSVALLTRLGWTQIGASNFDIPCVNHPKNTQGHGIDSLFRYFDPYWGKTINVIVESKYRKWEGLQPAKMKDFINQTVGSLECAPMSEQLMQLNAADIYTGLVMCWCNDSGYDYSRHLERVAKIGFRTKNSPLSVYLASNYDILRWYSVYQEVNKLKSQGWEIQYLYPSVNFRDRSTAFKGDHLTLIHMFSKYIFAYAKRIQKKSNGGSDPITTSIVFSFDAVSPDSLNLLNDVCIQYQMQYTDELIVYLYADELIARVAVEEFKRNHDNIEFRYLTSYEGITTLPDF